MVFTSHIFLFYFLPLVLGLYYLLPFRARTALIAVSSYVFYGWANPLWAVLMFAMGFMLPHVNNWAHLGGFGGGWVTAEAMRFSDEKRETPVVQVFALALLALTAAGVVLSFVKVPALMAG